MVVLGKENILEDLISGTKEYMENNLTTLFGSHLVNLSLMPGNGSVIVDAGASTGAFIKDIRTRVRNPIIYAIEPDRDNIQKLVYLLHIVLINSALVGKDRGKEITYYHKFGLPEWGNVNNLYPGRNGEKYPVKTINIDDLLFSIGRDIDYLKMDIEGSEEEVVFDLTEETAKRIKQISMELHGISHVKMSNKLERLGYKTIYKDGEMYAVYN